jgi:hypothetical protein
VDPAGQLFDAYSYSSNPISTIDYNGESFEFVQPLLKMGLEMAITGGIYGVCYWANDRSTFWEGFWMGAGQGAAHFGSRYLLTNVLPTWRTKSAWWPFLLNGTLEVVGNAALSYGAALALGASEKQAQNYAIYGGTQALVSVISFGSLVNPRSLACDRVKYGNYMNAANSQNAAIYHSRNGGSAWKYQPVRLGGLASLCYGEEDGSHVAGRTVDVPAWRWGTSKMESGISGWQETVMHEQYHLYSGDQDQHQTVGECGAKLIYNLLVGYSPNAPTQ